MLKPVRRGVVWLDKREETAIKEIYGGAYPGAFAQLTNFTFWGIYFARLGLTLKSKLVLFFLRLKERKSFG